MHVVVVVGVSAQPSSPHPWLFYPNAIMRSSACTDSRSMVWVLANSFLPGVVRTLRPIHIIFSYPSRLTSRPLFVTIQTLEIGLLFLPITGRSRMCVRDDSRANFRGCGRWRSREDDCLEALVELGWKTLRQPRGRLLRISRCESGLSLSIRGPWAPSWNSRPFRRFKTDAKEDAT